MTQVIATRNHIEKCRHLAVKFPQYSLWHTQCGILWRACLVIMALQDNPADFSYFFDTSRRRTCYIAPERFVESSLRMVDPTKDGTNLELTASEVKKGDLTPSMDVFSVGYCLLYCVVCLFLARWMQYSILCFVHYILVVGRQRLNYSG